MAHIAQALDQLHINQQELTAIDAQHRHFLRTVGTFTGEPHECIKAFIKKVDAERLVTNISSWETAKIVSESLLKNEAALEYQKYTIYTKKFPNYNYWCAQAAVEPREKVFYMPPHPEIPAVEYRAFRAAQGVQGEPGYLEELPEIQAKPRVPATSGHPELPAIRAEPKVLPDACLQAYLRKAFGKAGSVEAAAQHMAQYRTQTTNMSMMSYFNRLRIAMSKYHAIKFSDVQRDSADYPQWLDNDLMEAAKAGVIVPFRRYMENYDNTVEDERRIKDFDAMEALGNQWESTTTDGRDHRRKSKPFKSIVATVAAAETSESGNETPYEEEENYDPESVAASLLNRRLSQRSKPSSPVPRGRQGQAQGRGRQAAATANRGQGQGIPWFPPITDSRYPDYWQKVPPEFKQDGSQCHYCGLPGHPRPHCSRLRRDRLAKIDQPTHPNRGLIKSRAMKRRERGMSLRTKRSSAAAVAGFENQVTTATPNWADQQGRSGPAFALSTQQMTDLVRSAVQQQQVTPRPVQPIPQTVAPLQPLHPANYPYFQQQTPSEASYSPFGLGTTPAVTYAPSGTQ